MCLVMQIDYCNLLIFNKEFQESASHQFMLITSLPFVHTSRCCYRLSDSVNNSEIDLFSFADHVFRSCSDPHHLKEREVATKLSVGEPAEGSLTRSNFMFVHVAFLPCMTFQTVLVFDMVCNFPAHLMAKRIGSNATSSAGCLGSNNDERMHRSVISIVHRRIQ